MINKIRAYIVNELEKKSPLPKDVDINEYDYLSSGHIDSMGIIKFIMNIEEKYDIELTDEDIQSGEFRTIGGIAYLINKKLRSTQET